ncbi:MAG: hypothetical protein AAGE52_01445 [Myxococcota bacterium]
MSDEPVDEGRGLLSKWVEKLESGEYVQTESALKDDFGHCALGVLCDIAGVGKWVGDGYRFEGAHYAYSLQRGLSDELDAFGDRIVVRDLGSRLGVSPRLEQMVVEMNDGGATFDEIAEMLRDRLDLGWWA